MGKALKDYAGGNKKGKLIVHSPDFEPDEIFVSHYFRDYNEMPVIEKIALDKCRGAVMDAGAGAGSHALYLQRKGLSVTAVDSSAGACEVMKSRGVNKVVNDNALTFCEEKYDTVLLLMNGIGITGSLTGLDKYLKFLPGILNEKAQVIFDSTNLIYLYQNGEGYADVPLGEQYLGEIEYQMEYMRQFSPVFYWLFIDFDTLSWISEQNGFKAELIYEGDNLHYLARLS